MDSQGDVSRPSGGALERLFSLSARKTTVRREILGGVTTFMTMSYIIFANANILGDAKMPVAGVMVATCVSAALATILMGLLANLPVALAPGMGMNAMVAYGICGAMQYPWQQALGMVFLSGVAFLLLSAFRFRETVIAAIPRSMKLAAASGIGLFIAFIGLQHAGIVVKSDATLVQMGGLTQAPVLVALAGLAATCILLALKVNGSILFGLLGTGVLAFATGVIPLEWKSYEFSYTETFFALDIPGALTLAAIPAIATLLFFDLFDTVGTLMGVAEEGGLADEQGRIPNVGRALISDAAGTVIGAVAGTTTVTSYIESAAGVAAGARTGLSSLVVAALFIVALPLLPLAGMLANATVTAPALIVVGFLMSSALRKIEWDDVSEGIPAFLTVIMMPLTFSISAGLAVGMVSYVVLKLVCRKGGQVHPLMYAIVVCIAAGYVAIRIVG